MDATSAAVLEDHPRIEEPKYIKGREIRLKGHPRFDETWVKERISADTSLLGLGNMKVRDVERIQKRGRLDLLLVDDEDEEDVKWYEVEVQLGETDASHIIRTIEYWDEEQRRYPNRKHCAVLVAEDVTNRFFNVISLFNRHIPIIAIQMKAIQVEDYVLLHFTHVLDTVERRGEEDETEDKTTTPASREYWESRSSEASMRVLDECLGLLKQFAPGIALNYKQQFVGLALNARANNFVHFHPRKQPHLKIHAHPASPEEWRERLRNAGLEVLPSGTTSVRFRLRKEDLDKNRDLVTQLFRDSYEEYTK
ncbi:MAG: hypothetical protein DMG35_08265 [Acidobacteria bacterium]|nr:MAG: hypothetical protein DMG35_08265 [Acidobacteriota bacterium]